MAVEIEVKVAVPDAAAMRTRIEAAGGVAVHPRRLEDDAVFDHDGVLAAAGRLLRLRRSGGRAVLTAKGPVQRERGYKERPEVETDVADPDGVAAVLETAGLAVAWRYQKYRTAWSLAGATLLLDEIPHGCFLEIEGPPAAIDAAAARLGVSPAEYRTESYRRIHEQACRERGEPMGDMLFGERS
jgi:adenylate cyclase class 2